MEPVRTPEELDVEEEQVPEAMSWQDKGEQVLKKPHLIIMMMMTMMMMMMMMMTIFWHLKTGTIAKSARFQVPKNGTSSAPI